MAQEQFDDLFLQVAGRAGGIQPLLDSFFGFLSRKTDFYVQYEPTVRAKMGFAPGVAERMLLDSLHKYPYVNYEDVQPQLSPQKGPPNTSSPSSAAVQSAEASTKYCPPHPPVMPSEEVTATTCKEPTQSIRLTEDGKQFPIGNGGYAEKYYWTQTLKEATVFVDISHLNIRGKDVACSITPRQLSLAVRGENILSGDLEDAVKVDESMWTIATASGGNGGSQIIITLDKTKHTWWKHILIGDPEIDTSKVDSTQNISEYDEETQATIRRLMYDQKQKRMGLPTSHEVHADNILQEAMYAPGSPFLMTEDSGGDKK